MDNTELATVIATAVAEAMRLATAPPTAEQLTAQLSGARVPQVPVKIVRIRSRTGATFTARIQPAKGKLANPLRVVPRGVEAYPHGQIVGIEDYEYPAGADVSVDDGGAVPAGVVVRSLDGRLTQEYVEWRHATFLRPDFATYCGQAYDPRDAEDQEEAFSPAPFALPPSQEVP
jgi:hypothetical protein